ncbi:MAG: hypothetical protein Q9184_003925 [Pyrenodesmia sp. 2 TL-2023]
MASVEATPQLLVQQVVLPTSSRRSYRRSHRGPPARNPQNRHPGSRPPPTPGDQHNNPAAPSHDPSLAFRPASVSPASQSSSAIPSSAEHSAAENGAASIPRGGARNTQRGPRGGRRGGAVRGRGGQANNLGNPEARHVTGTLNGHGNPAGGHLPASRQFGGRLTAPAESGESASHPSSILSADAPEFRPGQQHHDRARNVQGSKKVPAAQRNPHPHHTHSRRDSSLKSTAPDITTRTHEDISNSLYECPICTSEVGRNSKVWSCKTCWTVFHLSCIKKWSANEGSTLTQQRGQDGQVPPPRQWRCPGCNLPKDDIPIHYTCWCEKELDPRSISGIPPHSCGQTCGKPRILPQKCPHPCELLCHAGPCPPCTHMGPTESCFCGKNATSKRCIDTVYDVGWSCGQICGDLMPCGVHTCQEPCHEGLCGACEVDIDSGCYCGKIAKPVPCCDREDEKTSVMESPTEENPSRVKEWLGSFHCRQVCDRVYDCGKHRCERSCHPQDTKPAHCPRSPDVVKQCHCECPSAADVDEYRRPQSVTRVRKKDRNVDDPARPRSIVDDMSVANIVALASAKHWKDKPPNVNYVHLEHLGPLRMKSKPNIYAPGLVDDLSNAAIILVPNFVTKAHAVGAEKLSSMS